MAAGRVVKDCGASFFVRTCRAQCAGTCSWMRPRLPTVAACLTSYLGLARAIVRSCSVRTMRWCGSLLMKSTSGSRPQARQEDVVILDGCGGQCVRTDEYVHVHVYVYVDVG